MHKLSSCHAKQSRAIRGASGSLGFQAGTALLGCWAPFGRKSLGSVRKKAWKDRRGCDGGWGAGLVYTTPWSHSFIPCKGTKDTSVRGFKSQNFIPLRAASHQEKGELGVSWEGGGFHGSKKVQSGSLLEWSVSLANGHIHHAPLGEQGTRVWDDAASSVSKFFFFIICLQPFNSHSGQLASLFFWSPVFVQWVTQGGWRSSGISL